jgi:CHAD domain-containing protein
MSTGDQGGRFVVQTFAYEFVLAGQGDDQPADDGILDLLASRFSLVPAGRPHTVRRIWLDSFDWRLHRAGLTLEHTTGAGPGQLSLAGPDGERLTARPGRLTWPSLAGQVPDGPLQARLCPVTGVRALLPAARGVSMVRDFRVLNSDDKTVAWLTLDRLSVTYPTGADLASRLVVTAVRGYQAQAERVAQILAGAPGVTGEGLSPLDAALAAAGRRAGDYTSQIKVRLAPRGPAAAAARAVLLDLLGTLEANVPGTIRDLDTEFLHDLRVAVRRTRSVLKLLGDVLPAELAAQYRPEFKWLGDLTTPTRDLDVYLLNYPQMAASLVAATPAELQPLHAHLTRSRTAELRRLVRGLRSARFTRLTAGWRAALDGLPASSGGPATADVAADRIRRAHRRVLRQGGAITAGSPPENLHDLRKRCKELRYLLESFASLHDPVLHRRAVKELKGLQDCLGEFQDGQVQQHEIRMFAAGMMTDRDVPATALLAMGELAARLARQQAQARGEFAGQFSEFASAANQQRFRALTSGAAA